MAVTKSQLAQWSKEYEKKYPEKKNTEAAQTAANGTNTARPKAEHVTKAQLAQWSAEFDAGQAAKQEQEKNALSSKAFDEYRANNNLGFADEMDSRRDWADGRALSAPRPADTGAVAYGDSPAQKLKVSYTPYSQKDEFDRLNEWFDQPRNQELVGKLLEQKSGFTTYAEQGTSRNAASAGDGSIDPFRTAAGKSQSGAKYTDDDLRKQGYSAAEIAQARDYLTQYDAIPEWKKQARRAGNTIGGIADSVAGSAVMTGETAVQSAKNIADTQKNWAKVQQEIKGDERAERLFQLLTDVDMDYNPVYPESRNRDLVLMGYGSEEIREMRDRLAGLEANDGIDPETSVGYQLYKRGQELTGAAQSGLTEGSRAVQGAVSSAAENLAVSSINPAAVLPVLSLQGAGDAMGQSIEKGESAGKTLAGGALKFGAGWGINSVGAADLAKTMGSDYAKDTLAGQIAAKMQSLVGDAPFAKAHPTVAAALSGGIDNAMQAFVESYADKAIDAALGDEKAAQSLFTTDTLIAALESGLSGGASGAMGGAVGSALAKYNDGNASLLGQAEYYDQLDKYEKAVAAEKKRQQRVEEPGTALSAIRPADTGASRSSPEVGALLQGSPAGEEALEVRTDSATEGSIQEQTAVNDDPAAHTAAQNASIEEYKNSVDPEAEQTVENAGETVETDRVNDYADVDLKVDPAGLDAADWNRSEQKDVARELVNRAQMSTKAAQAVVDAMPQGVGAAVYAQAANSLYRMGVMQDVTFEKALELTGSGSLGGATGQVLALGEIGENALRIAYTYGKGEAEAYNAKKVSEISGGGGVAAQDAGTYYVGDTVRSGQNADDAFIELGAKSSGTAVHRMMEGLKSGAKGFLQTAAGRIYLSGEAGSETMMHETFHALNEWSPETGQAVMDRLMKYLVETNGMESTEKLVQSYLDKYAASGQKVTYNQALEEVTADAMETVFGDAESFRDFVRQQAAEAKMNAKARGAIGKVMEKIENLLQTVLKDVERFLKKEPTNAAAKAAKSLTEEQLRDLRELYFEHQAEAGAKYREALAEDKTAPSETKEAAVKYSLPDMAKETEAEKTKRQMALTIHPAQTNAERTARVSETNWSGQKTQDVYKAIRTILNEFGIPSKTFRMEDVDVEFNYGSRNIQESVNKQRELTSREYNDFALVQANIEEVLADAVPLEAHADKKGKPHVEGMIVLASALQDGERIIPVRAELKLYDNRPTALYMAIAETTAEESRNAANKKEPDRKVRQEPLLTQEATFPGSSDRTGSEDDGSASAEVHPTGSSDITITDLYNLVKHDANFAKYFSDEVAYKAEGLDTLQEGSKELEEAQNRLEARARAIEKDQSYLKDLPGAFPKQDADGKYQLDVDADAADAAKTGLGNVAEQTETIQKAVEAGGNKRVSDEGLENIAKAVKSDTKSRIDVKTLTERLRGLSEYLSSAKNVNWGDAHAFMLDIAEQIMLKSSSKNDTLWKQHPELHEMGMKVEKGSTAFQELVYRYGSWANAKRELGRHGVKITQLPEGQHSRWDADFRELQELGAGLFPDEVPNSAADALEAMANAHNAIKPVLENAFDEDWEGAKQDIALQIWQRYLASPELANAESAKLRKSLNQQWTEMRQQAKQEALEARAKAQLRLADKQQNNAQWASRELAKRTEQEKARRDAQIDKVRTAREADNTRRSIRRLTTQITQSLTGDKAGKNVPEYLVDKVRSVAVIANEVIGNDKALAKLGGQMNREMGNLQRGLEKQMSMSDRAGIEWQNSGIDEMVADWISDVDASRMAALDRVNKEIERAQKRLDTLQQSAEKTGKDYSRDEADMKAYLAHLKMQRMEYENGGMARMTIEQLRGLREILEQTVYLVQNENKLLGEAERTELDSFATGMKSELRSAKGLNFAKGLLGNLSQKTAGYKLNTMGIQRQFERMGGYQHGGYMEKAGQMLNQGQYKRTKLLVEGTRFFDNVTGEKNLKNMDRFTHELVDIGLKTDDGRTWKITREQAVALYFQAQNMQGLHHMTHGGLKILNMEYAVKGDRERALHDAQTIRIGDLKFDKEGHILNKEGVSANEAEVMQLMGGQRTTLLAELEKVLFEGDMADYCKAWIDDYKEYGKFTKQHINETSMVLNGRAKAQVENYIPLRVDEDTRMTENTGIQYDNSVGSESFLKSRVNSSKPIWLDGIGGVVNTSLENVAQYAGMAILLRNVQKLLNTQIDGKNINAEIRLAWGTEGIKYMEKALADLYPQKGKTADYGDGAMAKLRSVAAAAVLTANLNVTLLQAASLPTAAAELGWGSTGHAAVQFVKNVDPVNKLLSAVGLTENSLKKVEAEIMEHGDVLLQYRLRGTQNGELGTMGEVKKLLGKAHDEALSGNILTRGGVKFLDVIAGSITKMDEITVAALWNGAKDYVVKNPTKFDADAQQKDSAAYWDAVNRQFQRTVERTQPNYTPMQRTGMQRSSNQALKFLMMYSTQRQQNCQIVVAAAEDRAAQARRYNEQPTAENKEALDAAKKRLGRAITSQAAAAGVISAMGIFVKYLLHRRKDLEDENGDITLESLGKRFCWGMVESLASNPVGGSEIWSTVSVVKNGSDYDALSVSGLSNLNDFIAQVSSQMKRIRKDTSEMDEAELKQYTDSVKRGYLDIVGSALSLRGVPYTNVMKIVDAAGAYWDDWVNEGTLLTTSDTPSSATGQYDRLYDAIQNGDTEEVQGATKKLAQMLKEGKIKEDKTEGQLGSRLKKYDPDILAAAQAQNAGKLEDRKDAKQEVFDRLCTAYGVKKQGEKGETNEDKARRKWFIALIDKAVKEKAEELLKGGSSGSVYDQMKSALDGGTASDVQTEIDRLLKAGKESSNIKTEVTKAVREEYLAGNDHDREKLAEMLLRLEAGGEPLYEEKNFESWIKQDEKKQEAAAGAVDEWAEVR